MSINVHIERLILEGLPGRIDRVKLGAAVEAELAVILDRESLAGAVSRHEARANGLPLRLVRPNDSGAVGKQIAGALRTAITSPGKSNSPCRK
jgi:hypothetical protein